MEIRGTRKELTGVVLNNSADKTVKVLVERLAKHKRYRKYIRYRKKYIMESRPVSKLKRWRVLEILS